MLFKNIFECLDCMKRNAFVTFGLSVLEKKRELDILSLFNLSLRLMLNNASSTPMFWKE